MDPTLLIALIGVLLQKGVPAVVGAFQAWQKDPASITVADIQALGETLPDPESFFKDKPA